MLVLPPRGGEELSQPHPPPSTHLTGHGLTALPRTALHALTLPNTACVCVLNDTAKLYTLHIVNSVYACGFLCVIFNVMVLFLRQWKHFIYFIMILFSNSHQCSPLPVISTLPLSSILLLLSFILFPLSQPSPSLYLHLPPSPPSSLLPPLSSFLSPPSSLLLPLSPPPPPSSLLLVECILCTAAADLRT